MREVDSPKGEDGGRDDYPSVKNQRFLPAPLTRGALGRSCARTTILQIGICLISTLNLRFLETLYIHALPLLVDHDVAIAESFSHFSNAVLQLQSVFFR